jgi:hypothetical protein
MYRRIPMDVRINKKITKAAALSILFLSLSSLPVYALTAEEIIQRMEDNQVHDTAYSEGRINITDRFGEKVSTFKSWAKGEEKSLIEFTSREERGQKILRTDDEIYLFFPDAAEIIRLQGAALRDSVLGSDLSYEDMTGDRGLLDSYKVELLGTERVDGEECYKIEMNALRRDVPYPKEIVWIDTELFVGRKVHKFSLSGKLLKEMVMLDYTSQAGKMFPTEFLVVDKMKRNSSTLFIIEKIEIGVDLPAHIFSLEELTW